MKKRKSGYDVGDIKKESFRYHEDTKAVASPAAHYGIPKDTISGDTEALVTTLKSLSSAIPATVKEQQKQGSLASLRGETRPEGIFSQPRQEGWDYTEGQAIEGKLYTAYDERIQKLGAKFNGKNPGEFLKDVKKMTDNLDKEFLKDKSDSYLAGMQGALAKVHRDTALVAQSIIKKKVGDNGIAQIKALFGQQLIETEQSGMSPEGKAYKNHTYLREMQELGKKYGLDNNAVTMATFQATQPSGRTNPKMYDYLYIKDADSIAPKDTAGGKGVDDAVFAAQRTFKDNIPTVAYKTLKKLPSLIKADNSFDYVGANEILNNPENWEALGIETKEQADSVRASLTNSRVSVDNATAQVRKEYTTKTLNKAYDMVYKSKTQNTNDAISFVRASNIDGLVKHRVIKGLLTNTKKGDSHKFNTTMNDILSGKIKHPESVYQLMGNQGGVTFEEGKQLLSYFNLVNSEEISALKNTVSEVQRVLTKGGLQLDGFSSIRQAAAKNAAMRVVDMAAKTQKAGKEVDWSALAKQAIQYNTPTRSQEMEIMAKSFSASKAGRDSIEAAGGKFVILGAGKDSIKVSPGLQTFEDFTANVIAWINLKNPTKPITAAGYEVLMANPAKRDWLMKKYEEYNINAVAKTPLN